MQGKRRLQSKLLAVILLTISLAQSSVPLNNPKVREIGELLACQCGCPYSVSSCNMTQCHFADPAREELLSMVQAGKSEKEILDLFVAKHGLKILRKPPSEGFYMLGWVMPWIGLGLGLALLYWIVKRYLGSRPAVAGATAGPADVPVPETPEMRRYRDQIEKETSDLE